MSTLSLETSVGQLVAEQPARSRVFERWGLDYCCGGKRPLAEACEKKGIDPEAVLYDLAACDRISPAPTTDWTQEPLSALCDHIEQTHHGYLREALPRLTFLTAKVADRHGERDPRLVELRDTFVAFRQELEQHMFKEEQILFPLVRQLDDAAELPAFHCGSVNNPIAQMVAEHDDAGEALERMSGLTYGFQAQPNDCNTHRAMLQALAELEEDMHRHIHKENSILFLRAEAKESELASARSA